ncbi:hypothetical protein SAMD00019534_021210 [Acytostelium subglobosum LB1]|uniref:hypothetical protein n=1 Tax=Acytostelium subglobosum LB1 TaxID=1410327 RepID=UPI00064489DC|nr:hypothetical protein SAMD00019534_021210 [Acytostelium subglobosum LB1]GAM18946.1 hypothetical protein SAMD00019534_021210 [Acytostelium subglobosum LB1]|eukprot:XP_012758166.1 hypothetical protein SAMD00019534_021210 [Acytostelium subglobosum LB1]
MMKWIVIATTVVVLLTFVVSPVWSEVGDIEFRIGGEGAQHALPHTSFKKDKDVNIKSWTTSTTTNTKGKKTDQLLLASDEKGVFASRDIKEGEEIVSLSWFDTFSADRIKAEDPWLFDQIVKLELISEDALAVALLYYRYCKEELSEDYSQWFSAFPETLNTGLYFTEEEIDLLRGSPAYVHIQVVKSETKQVFERLRSSLFQSKQFELCTITWDRFKWATSIVTSRKMYTDAPGVDEQGNPVLTVVLAPFIDHFNHNEDAQAVYDFDHQSATIKVTTIRPVKSGEQIFFNYGNQDCNSDLLVDFGFIDQSPTRKNCVNILIEELVETMAKNDPKLKEKTEILQQSFEENGRMKLFKDSLTEELLKLIKYLSYKNQSLLHFLQKLVELKKNNYPSTLEDDQTLVATDTFKNMSYRAKLAIKMRLQEKEILRDIGKLIQDQIAQTEKQTTDTTTTTNSAKGRDEL